MRRCHPPAGMRRCVRVSALVYAFVAALVAALAACATGPKGGALQQRVEQRLASDHRLCPYRLTVSPKGAHGVRIDGRVESAADRRRAVEIARGSGAVEVVDRLQVGFGAGLDGSCP